MAVQYNRYVRDKLAKRQLDRISQFHRPSVALEVPDCIRHVECTNNVFDALSNNRCKFSLDLFSNRHGGVPRDRFPYILRRMHEENVTATLLCFSNLNTVTTGTADFWTLYCMFVMTTQSIVCILNQIDPRSYGDMYFSNFIVVNQPHKGNFKRRLDLAALQKARPLEVSNNTKFPGASVKCNGVNITLFNSTKFIMTGARDIGKINGALRELATKVDGFLVADENSNPDEHASGSSKKRAVKAPAKRLPGVPTAKRRKVAAF